MSPTLASSSSRPPSERPRPLSPLTPVERAQRDLLVLLSGKYSSPLKEVQNIPYIKRQGHPFDANTEKLNSFSFPIKPDTFTETSAEPNPFTRSSADDINTRFVNDEAANKWQFSAGGASADPLSKPRAQSGSRVGRRSPMKRPGMQRNKESFDDTEAPPETSASGFDASNWDGEFGSEHFAHKPTVGTSASPTRAGRHPSRKAKSVRPTMGNAGMVFEDSTTSSSDEGAKWRGRRAEPKTSADSPNAMDIDPPLEQSAPTTGSTPSTPVKPTFGPKVTTAAATTAAAAALAANSLGEKQPPVPRNIPVEPSRPEWRAGTVHGTGDSTKFNASTEPATEPNVNAAGSEDSEEFKASFSDLRNVAPFAQQATGLSMGDLGSSLPFESRPSARIPIKKEKAVPNLNFPKPPDAPRPPPTLAVPALKPNANTWKQYVDEFAAYVNRWEDFNKQVVSHFVARGEVVDQRRPINGHGFLSDAGLEEYLNWMEQDKDVRKKWSEACHEHELRLKEFVAFRHRMK
jgi:hypothetical protein